MSKKKDIQRVNAVARRYGMSRDERDELGELVHWLKDRGFFGTGEKGDFTFKELCEIARDSLGLEHGDG